MSTTKHARPTGEGWMKTPSVTPGGKAHFYYRRDPLTDHRQWYLFDRVRREWIYQDEDPRTGEIVTGLRDKQTHYGRDSYVDCYDVEADWNERA